MVGAAHPLALFIQHDVAGTAAGLLAALSVLLLVLGRRARGTGAHLGQRLDTFVSAAKPEPAPAARAAAERPSFRQRVVVPVAAWLAKVVGGLLPDQQIQRIRRSLATAGFTSRRHLTYFLAAKAGLAVAGVLIATFYIAGAGAAPLSVLIQAVLGGVLGFYLPGIWLGRRMTQRRLQLLKALPDALDLLSISVGAGLGFDGAVNEVVQRTQSPKNPLATEFATVLRDVRLGKSRREALHGFAERADLPEVGRFVSAVIQAEQLGAPIRDTLQIQAEQMRLRRRHRAEELARKAAIKMIIPMAVFILPALFIVIIGPALPSLSTFGLN